MINKFDLNNISRKLSTTGNKVYISRSHASHPDQSHVVWQCTLMYSQSYGFSRSHVQMWKLDHKEGWVLKNWCFQIVVLEKTLASPLDSKEIKPVNLKGNKPWIFIGRIDAKAEDSIFWSPNANSQLIGKNPDDGKDWRQEKGVTEDEMVGWRHQLNGHDFEQTPGDSEGQGGLVGCSPRGRRESFMTWRRKNSNKGWPRRWKL